MLHVNKVWDYYWSSIYAGGMINYTSIIIILSWVYLPNYILSVIRTNIYFICLYLFHINITSLIYIYIYLMLLLVLIVFKLYILCTSTTIFCLITKHCIQDHSRVVLFAKKCKCRWCKRINNFYNSLQWAHKSFQHE